jgi:hypothetical protein
VRADGSPLINQEVRLHIGFTGQSFGDKTVAGGDLRALTDDTGKAEFLLPRSQKVGVAITGTTLVRTITVPDKDTFNLLDPDLADDDIFRVQVPDIVVAERRSL